MKKKNDFSAAASAFGFLGGSVISKKKTASSRLNIAVARAHKKNKKKKVQNKSCAL